MPAYHEHPDWPAVWLPAIRAEPSRDDVRLACADWLDDQGAAERAELIRLMVAEPGLEMCVNHAGSCGKFSHFGIGRRVCDLIAGLKADWMPVWYTIPANGRNGLIWRRGFVEENNYCPAAAWMAHGDALLAREPVARVVLSGVVFAHPLRNAPVVIYSDRDFSSDGGRYRDIIPDSLFRLLAGGRWGNTAESTREYPTADAARADLLAALLLRWPGVKFELPPAEPVFVGSVTGVDSRGRPSRFQPIDTGRLRDSL